MVVVTAFGCFAWGVWLALLVLWVWLSCREAGELQRAASKSFSVCQGTCVHEKHTAFPSSSAVQRCRLFNTSFQIKMAERAGFLRWVGIVFFLLFPEVASSALDMGSR